MSDSFRRKLSLNSTLLHFGSCRRPITKQQINRPTDRVNLLIADLDAKNEHILIPMPALAEFLFMVGPSGALYLNEIHRLPRFKIGEFTEKAAIEVSQVIRKALESVGKQKRDEVEATWAKVNFDRQIVAIAKAAGCSTIYSTDGDVKKHAAKMNITCLHLADLPLPAEPPVEPQMILELAAEHTEELNKDSDDSKTNRVTAPAAMPDPTAQVVSENESNNASNLSSIPASTLELAQNLKQPSTKTNANQNQPEQTSEESNQSNPETDLTKAERA